MNGHHILRTKRPDHRGSLQDQVGKIGKELSDSRFEFNKGRA